MTATPTRMAARMTGNDRRNQLIEVAIDLFSRKGFGGTTTKEIAAAAGVTEAIVFRHFATKKDLYTAILEFRLKDEKVEGWLTQAQTFMDRRDDEGLFRLLAKAIVEQFRQEPGFEKLMLFAALEGH